MGNGLDNKTIAFHLQLLAHVIDMDTYPFIKLVIQSNLSQKEYEETMELLKTLNKQYQLQKEEGLLDFSSLLLIFAKKLNEKLEPDTLLYALKKEGYYPELVSEFIRLLQLAEAEEEHLLSRRKRR